MARQSLDWMDDALCTQVGPDPFFPGPGPAGKDGVMVCENCPVMEQCRDWAASEPFGVWGGELVKQRERRVGSLAGGGWSKLEAARLDSEILKERQKRHSDGVDEHSETLHE